MDNTFTDHRGSITDLLLSDVAVDAVTYITFVEGAVRGNHVHKKTDQYDYVLSGELVVKTDISESVVRKGDYIELPAGVPHAYRAVQDSVIVSMTFGPRKRGDYSKDTFKLEIPLLS